MNSSVLPCLVTGLLVVTLCRASCPPSKSIKPCKCDPLLRRISCSSSKKYHLDQVLEAVAVAENATQEFDEFYANRLPLVGLEEGTLAGIRFKKITIVNGDLVYINPDAFIATAANTKAINLSNNKLTNLIFPGKGDLFDAFKVLTKAQVIILENNNLRTIPSKAFEGEPGSDSKIWYIDLAKNEITEVGEKAFSSLPFLTYLDLSDNKITTISGRAFEFNRVPYPSAKLTIFLANNHLDENSFESRAFSLVKRPIELYLQRNRLKALKESVFRSFLSSENSNIMDVEGNPIACEESVCALQWLTVTTRKLKQQVMGLKCSDGSFLWDRKDMADANCSLHQEVEAVAESSAPSVISTSTTTQATEKEEEEKTERLCPVGHYQCYQDRCLPVALLCDGRQDCNTGDDEEYCGQKQDLVAATEMVPINQTEPCLETDPIPTIEEDNNYVSINIKLNRLNHTIVKKVLHEIGITGKK